MKINCRCPCCNKNVQIILSDNGTDDFASVFLNEESDKNNKLSQDELEHELAEKHNILLG